MSDTKHFKMKNYADNGRLETCSDAEFLAGKIGMHDSIDFSDITFVSAEFLAALFAGQPVSTLAGRLHGVGSSIAKTLENWFAAQTAPVTGQNDKTSQSSNSADNPTSPTPYIVTPENESERYTPGRLMKRLKEQLFSFIESAYPLSDPILIEARKKILEQNQRGRVLAQEPFIETTPRYKTWQGTYADLGLAAETGNLFTKLSQTAQQYGDGDKNILFDRMYLHQADAYRAFLNEGKDIIIATGTGSGKTECFLLPILGRLYLEAARRPQSFARPGIRSLILYPMNALVNDQLSRLRLLFGDKSTAGAFAALGDNARHPLFGMYTGRTLYPGRRDAAKDRERVKPFLEWYLNLPEAKQLELKKLGRYPAKNLKAFFASDESRNNNGRTSHNWKKRLLTQPEDCELLLRHEMVRGSGHDKDSGHAPDILVTNYSMLEYMLMRPFEQPIFDETRAWLEADEANQFLLVLDEAHLYQGAKGAEIGFLLRRLWARLGIAGRPEKIRVILTSASLGSSEEAFTNVQRFAADISGKTPADFTAITGEQEVPENCSKADHKLAEILAAISVEDLHQVGKPEKIAEAVKPLLAYYGRPFKGTTEEELFRLLHEILSDEPCVNLLIKEIAGNAKALAHVAGKVFADFEQAGKAMEALLTLGTLARKTLTDPGLLPLRVHAFFKGLNSLYACINPKCSGRQARPGETAPLGKLFTEPAICCDACGSRVFELESCMNCGTPYIKAYHPENKVSNLEFLWGETEGKLRELHLLTMMPRYPEKTHEIKVHLKTGFVDTRLEFPDDEVRSFWVYQEEDNIQPAFKSCPRCQAPDSRTRARISGFFSRGEEPFAALIEAQFAEQPPQKNDPALPNQGRKVLVFSDGRQKAARLAPAIEESHNSDLFRQVMALAAAEMKSLPLAVQGMHNLYSGILYICSQRNIDLFPKEERRKFRTHLNECRGCSLRQILDKQISGRLQPDAAYAQALYKELTERFFSLQGLGLGQITFDTEVIQNSLNSFPDVGLTQLELLPMINHWLRVQLEDRRFSADGADLNNMTDDWYHPRGIDPNRADHLIPQHFAHYLERLLGDSSKTAMVGNWFKQLVQSNAFEMINNLYYLHTRALRLDFNLECDIFACTDCGRLSYQLPRDLCPECCGQVQKAETSYIEARTGYYRSQIRRARTRTTIEPFGLQADEHTAQLTGRPTEEGFNKTEQYELRFQDIMLNDHDGPIDLLSCTTTMEVGIDIGSLTGVALRNVPPQVANYQQRAGRAGRRGRSIASVITYAHGTSHDSYYFQNPEKIISGEVKQPRVYISNEQVMFRHIAAFLIQRYFHENIDPETADHNLFQALGTVEEFLNETSSYGLTKMLDWLESEKARLAQELGGWLPTYSWAFDQEIETARIIEKAFLQFPRNLTACLPVEGFKKRETLHDIERENLEYSLKQTLLETLVDRSVLPRYAFPIYVVTFWVAQRPRQHEELFNRRFEFEPQRDLAVALSEYAPGSSLTIDKKRFVSAALYSPYESNVASMLKEAGSYYHCENCGYVSLAATARPAGCPNCGSEKLKKQKLIVPQGFAPDINEKPDFDRGEGQQKVGQTTRAQLEVEETNENWQDAGLDGRLKVAARSRNLVMVNKGIMELGFMICPDCGRAEPRYGPGYVNPKMFKGNRPTRHNNPIEAGKFCNGEAQGPFYLGHRFHTDVLLLMLKLPDPMVCPVASDNEFSGKAGRSALTSFVEALSLAASRVLQIEEGELSGNWSPVLNGGNQVAQVFLYDLLPGGAGYTLQVKEQLRLVLEETERLLADCNCETSCYRCIRHFGNNFFHHQLERKLALDLVRNLLYGMVPEFASDEKSRCLAGLKDILRLRGYKVEENVNVNGVMVPMRIGSKNDGQILVDVHHPLTDPAKVSSVVCDLANQMFRPFKTLDSFSLIHDLPAAFEDLRLKAAN